MFISTILWASSIGFGVALLVSLGIVLTKHLHGSITLDESHGVQKVHDAPTPRVGGIALASGFFGVWFFMPADLQGIWGMIGLAGLPALVFGIAEDFTKQVSVRWRLLATGSP